MFVTKLRMERVMAWSKFFEFFMSGLSRFEMNQRYVCFMRNRSIRKGKVRW